MVTVKKITAGLLVIIALVAIGSFLATRDNAPIVIGFVGGLTGKAADLGIDCRRGTELAVAGVNRSGGIDKHPIELVALDDGQDEEQARQAVKSLIARGLPVIIGHTTSAMSIATLPIINQSSTLLVSPTSSTPLLLDIDDNFIRSCVAAPSAAIPVARYLRHEKGFNKAAVVYDIGNRAYTEQWYHAFAGAFEAEGDQLVEPFTFTSGPDGQLLPLVDQMRPLGFDVLVVVANSVDAAMLSQQVRKTGWNIQLAFADWAATEQLIDLGGASVEGAIISQFFNRKSQKPSYVAFRQEFETNYNAEPGFGALHAYNATTMVLESMKQQRHGESLKQAILRISHFAGLQDDIVINRYGDSNHPTYIGIIQNGMFNILGDYR